MAYRTTSTDTKVLGQQALDSQDRGWEALGWEALGILDEMKRRLDLMAEGRNGTLELGLYVRMYARYNYKSVLKFVL